MVWLGLLKVNFINHIGISLSLSFYKEFSTLHLWGNNPYGIELLRFMREKDYAFLDNNCNLDNRCRSIIWKEWLWWHSEFLAIFLFEHHRIYEKNAFQSDYEASLHKLFFCLRKPQLWTPLSSLYLTIPLFSLFFSLYHTSFILPTSHPTSIPLLLLTSLSVSQKTIYKSLLDFFHFSPSKHKIIINLNNRNYSINICQNTQRTTNIAFYPRFFHFSFRFVFQSLSCSLKLTSSTWQKYQISRYFSNIFL